MQTTCVVWIKPSGRLRRNIDTFTDALAGISASTPAKQVFRRLLNSPLARNFKNDAALLTSPIFTSKETL